MTNTTERKPGDKIAMTRIISDDLKKRFLEVFGETCNMSTSAESLDIPRSTVYYWLRSDPQFKEHFDQARLDGAEVLEDVAIKRATDTSDRLISFLLKSYRPERFGDKIDVTSGGKPIDLSWPEAGKVDGEAKENAKG